MKKKLLCWAIKVAVIAVAGYRAAQFAYACGFAVAVLLDGLLGRGSEIVGWLVVFAVYAVFIKLAVFISRIGVEKRADIKKMDSSQKLRTPLIHILPAAAIVLSVTVLPEWVSDMKYKAQKADVSRMAWEYLEKADEVIEYHNGSIGFYSDNDLPFDRDTIYIDYDEMHLTLVHKNSPDGTARPGCACFRPLTKVDADPYADDVILFDIPLEAPGKRMTFYDGDTWGWAKAIIVEMADGSLWKGDGGYFDVDNSLGRDLDHAFKTADEVIEFDFGRAKADFPIISRGITTDTLFIDLGESGGYDDATATFVFMLDEYPQYNDPSHNSKLRSEVHGFEPAEISDLEKLNVCTELELEAPDKRLFIYKGTSDDSGEWVPRGLILATEDGRYFTLRTGNSLAYYENDPGEQPDPSDLPWSK